MPSPAIPLWYRLARAMWHGPAGRAVERRRRIRTLANTLKRSELVRERVRFVVRDLRGSERVARYTLAPSGTPVCLRHATDRWTFDELLVHGEYDPPSEVETALARIGRPLRVLDLGANIGLFGSWVAANWDVSSIVSFEPDPGPAAVLREQSRGHAGISWEVVRAAAWNADGPLPFTPSHVDGHVELNATNDCAFSVIAEDVLPRLVDVDLVKIDMEGSEWTVLEDPRFAAIGARVIVVESHPRLCPDPDDPASTAARALERAGLRVVNVRPKHSGIAVLWAIRPTDDHDQPPPRAAARAPLGSEAAPSA